MKDARPRYLSPVMYPFSGGFSLGEVLIAVLCLGLLLAPFLQLVTSLPAMQRQLGLQARDEAWRSFQEQAVSAGMDPSRAAALLAGSNRGIPAVKPESIERGAPSIVLTGVSLRVLKSKDALRHSEDRAGGSGWELSRGRAYEAPEPPAPPLLPVTMKMPDISPLPGAIIPLSGIEQAGEPKLPSLLVRAGAEGGARVLMKLGRAGTLYSGYGEAQGVACVDEVAVGLVGTAWTEYPGEPAAGHRPVEMLDGRKRWLVPEGRGLRTYEPSGFVSWSYTLDLGVPILRFAGAEIQAGTHLRLDYATLTRVRGGEPDLRVDWPDATKAALGSLLDLLTSGFDVAFAGNTGSVNGDLRNYCSEETLELWTEACPLLAKGIPAQGCMARTAAWTLGRGLTELGQPELVTAAVEVEPFSQGSAEFLPPAQADGVRRGRLSARDGALISTSSNLSVPIIP